MSDEHSFSQSAELTCPDCGRPVAAEVWLIVDAAERPDLLERIRAGTLHTVACPNGHEGRIDAPLLLLRPEGEAQRLVFSPAQETSSEQDREHLGGLMAQLRERLGAAWRDEWLAEGLPNVPRGLLTLALEEGVEAALRRAAEQAAAELERLRRADPQAYRHLEEAARQAAAAGPLAQAVQQFVEACTWDESRRVVAEHPELLSGEAEEMLRQLGEAAGRQGDENAARVLAEHRDLLRRCHEAGVETAFAEKRRAAAPAAPEELRAIFDELSSLTQPADMPRRAALCEQALRQIRREVNPSLWAALQGEWANSLAQNPLGSRADNLEQAIAAYEAALEVYTRAAFPEQWATTQNNLGTAYSDRIRGERADNLEQAIAAYEAALEVYTRAAFPTDWAMTQNNLGNAYRSRIRGERADNLEQAIAAYEAALEVYTRAAFPEQWATTQNNLGTAYSDRIRGERADNLEQAIAAYEAALTVRTRAAFPTDWAMTQNNLGNAYRSRIRGERADNLEQAIAAYEAALEVYTRAAFPTDWAMTQNNLGNAYRSRIRGERADNLEQAIAAYEAALTVRTRAAFPEQWATTQNNLGNAYRSRIRGERADNLEQAIAAYEAALTVRTRAAFPEQWATTQNNLGNAYSDRIRGERADNLEQAIAAYEAALEVYTRAAFPTDWAMTQNNLGTAYSDRIRGERADNLEQAIAAYEAALEVYTRAAFPEQWATTQNNLGNAYSDRIRGERADNLEQAIAAYEAALTVRTRAAFPTDWAMTQNNLGNAYSDRIRGERADNLEQAIAAYEAALTVRTRAAFPTDWAMTQNNLGNAYRSRIRGERADNLEQAIAAYEAALEVYTRAAFPTDWAMTQNNLGNAYRSRIRGERADNLEQAIAAYEAALEVYTRAAFPTDWAMTQNNLGTAYSDRIRGERADNLEQAIAAYEAALEVYTRAAFPEQWATTQNNLGNAYRSRIRGERADNLEQAIAAYEAALEVYTRAAFPTDWAMTQNNLGNAYSDRIRGERADNLEQAIAAYEAALEVYTRAAFPEQWATTQNNLGNAYSDRIRGERADNLEQAIAAYEAALTVRTRAAFPTDWAMTQNNLGNAYRSRIRGERADNLEQAIAAWQTLAEYLHEVVRSALEPRELAGQAAAVTRRLAWAYLERGRPQGALAALEAGRALRLRLDLGRAGRAPRGLSPPEADEHARLALRARQIPIEYRAQAGLPLSPVQRAAALAGLSRLYEQTLTRLRELEARDPVFSDAPPDYRALRALAAKHNLTLVYLQPTDEPALGTLAFVVHPASPPEAPAADDVLRLPDLTREDLRRLLFDLPPGLAFSPEALPRLPDAAARGEPLGWLAAYWFHHLARKTPWEQPAAAAWRTVMLRVLEQLRARLAAPLAARLRALPARRVVLLPGDRLALLPLHAVPLNAPSPSTNHHLPVTFGDAFEVSYAPSAAALARCLERAALRAGGEPTLVAVANPDGSLAFAEDEVAAVTGRFDGRARLAFGAAARLDWLLAHAPAADYLELSTHALFRPGEPGRSAMLLAHPGGHTAPLWRAGLAAQRQPLAALQAGCDRLALDDIWSGRLRLKEGCCVTASACETGQIDPGEAVDESLGFPAAFLGAGAASVIASLWAVDDLSTALLVDKTYELMLPPAGLAPPAALRRAAQWLRGLPKAEVLGLLEQWLAPLLEAEDGWRDLPDAEYYALYDRLDDVHARWASLKDAPDPPFAHPAHWAAFAAYGA